MDESGYIKVYAASIIDPEENNPILYPVETYEEWKHIEEILEKLSGGKK